MTGDTPDDLFQAVYAQLHEIAHRHLTGNKGHTLTPTVLIHEAYLRLCDRREPWMNRTHFLNAAALAMRHILISHARAKGRLKRGGNCERFPLDSGMATVDPPDEDVLALHDALTELAAHDPAAARVVELRYFGGVEWAEIAAALGVARDEVRDSWAFARAWLFKKLGAR